MSSVGTSVERATAEAAAWIARLQRADLSEQDGVEFDAWLDAAPDNRTAYEDALVIWQAFEEPRVAETLDEQDAHVRQIGARRSASRRSGPRPGVSRRWLAGGVGMAAAAALAVAVAPDLMFRPTTDVYATGKGEHRRVELADGSVVDLNAETKLSVTLARDGRRVTMAEGEAIFDVAHDTKRPFTVASAGRVVRVVGTQFDVKSRSGELAVTVARGKVQVRPEPESAGGRSFTLTPGQRLEVARSGVEALAAVDPQEAFSWRAGRLVYREQPLGEVVADLNRQFVDQIEVGDPELAKIPITGVIVLDDPRSVAGRLSLMLPIRSVPSDRGLVLLRK